MNEERRFPVLASTWRERERLDQIGCPRSVPWEFVAPHERQALRNHEQTLDRLAERGGLSPGELVAVVRGEGLSSVLARRERDAVALLVEMLTVSGSC